MSNTRAAHQRFVEFVADFYRDAGCPPPDFESDADHPIAFEVQVGGVRMTVGYDPMAVGGNLFVHCVLGPLPSHDGTPAMRRLLQRSLSQSREHGATYGIDRDTQDVICCARRPVEGVEVATLRDALTRLAHQALRWRADQFAEDDDAAADASADGWAAFA